jgi:hypothetical protein
VNFHFNEFYKRLTFRLFPIQSAQKKLDKNSDSEGEASEHESDDDEYNPKKNLIGRLKTAKLKLLEETMTEEQKQAEKE